MAAITFYVLAFHYGPALGNWFVAERGMGEGQNGWL